MISPPLHQYSWHNTSNPRVCTHSHRIDVNVKPMQIQLRGVYGLTDVIFPAIGFKLQHTAYFPRHITRFFLVYSSLILQHWVQPWQIRNCRNVHAKRENYAVFLMRFTLNVRGLLPRYIHWCWVNYSDHMGGHPSTAFTDNQSLWIRRRSCASMPGRLTITLRSLIKRWENRTK